jgi:hypothetical protein
MMRVTSTDHPRSVPAPPPAVRLVRPGWRDPRLVVGVLLVCASVLLGAKLLSSGDDTVAVWATRGPVAAGSALGADDLVVARVRFASEADAERYLAAENPPGEGLVAARDLGEGELVPAGAVRAGGERLRELPLTLPAGAVPPATRAGSRVDVWAVPRESGAVARGGAPAGGRPLLEDVAVVAVSRGGVGGPESMRQVVVGVGDSTDVGEVVEALGQGTALLVGRP